MSAGSDDLTSGLKKLGQLVAHFMLPLEEAKAARDAAIDDLERRAPGLARRAARGYLDDGLRTVRIDPRRSAVLHVRLQLLRVRALIAGAVRATFEPLVDVGGEEDVRADVIAERTHPPPPSSAFTLAILTSPIVPAAPPRLPAVA